MTLINKKKNRIKSLEINNYQQEIYIIIYSLLMKTRKINSFNNNNNKIKIIWTNPKINQIKIMKI